MAGGQVVAGGCRFDPTLPEEIYTASFRGDVKPLVPGYWLVLALSHYLVVSFFFCGGKLSRIATETQNL